MLNYCIYDIETYKSDRIEEYIDQAEIKPDARLKDPEKIQKSIDDKREAIRERAALRWITGRVIACGISFNGTFKFFTADDEKELLQDLDIFISGKNIDEFVGKNNIDFDQPFLIGRHLVNGLPVPEWLRRRHVDIQNFFGTGRSLQRASLADIEWALDIQRDGEKDALQCFKWWDEGDIESIEKYNKQDVESTERIYLDITAPHAPGGLN